MEQITFPPLLDVVSELPDRCDRCDAAAKLTCTLAEGVLAFCGHHANTHVDVILRTALVVRVLADYAWRGTPTCLSTVDG